MRERPEPLPPAGYAADVPRPSIGFSIDVPDHWVVLDLSPESWDTWLDAFLDQRLAGRRRAGEERPRARKVLLQLLRQLHEGRVFMAAVLAGEVGGEFVSASATLAWRRLDLGGDPMSLEGMRRVYADAPPAPGEILDDRRVELVELSMGAGVKVATRETLPVPGTGRIMPVNVIQFFIPVLDTDWLAVITATTGVPALATGVEEVADAMAGSLTFSRGPGADRRA
jgi:hypothetical protein